MEELGEFRFFQKCIIFGDNGVGKTTLINYIENDEFKEQSHTENNKL